MVLYIYGIKLLVYDHRDSYSTATYLYFLFMGTSSEGTMHYQ